MFERTSVADQIGVLDFRIGHKLDYRDSRQPRDEWLSMCWDMTFVPTFHEPWTIAVVGISQLTDDEVVVRSHKLAFLACKLAKFTLPLEFDPVCDLLKRIPVVHEPDFRQSRDGRRCQLRFTTTALDLTLEFANPELVELRSIESACLQTANTLSAASGNAKLIECVEHWKRYVEGTAQ
ncbi:MAG: hypothetical protein U0892_13440 [Pirellulales bacterium]